MIAAHTAKAEMAIMMPNSRMGRIWDIERAAKPAASVMQVQKIGSINNAMESVVAVLWSWPRLFELRKRTPRCSTAVTAITVMIAVRIVDTIERLLPINTMHACVTTVAHRIRMMDIATKRRSSSVSRTTAESSSTVVVASFTPSFSIRANPS